MTREFSLAHLTVLALPPAEMIDVAARAGYDYVGLRLNRVTPTEVLYNLIEDRALLRETQSRLSDTGVRVLDVELARMDPTHDAQSFLPLLETAAALGARHIITQLPDPDRARALDRFATICDLAAPLNLAIDLEFPSWIDVGSLAAAADVLRAVDKPNAGILVDTLHFDRSNSSLDELRALPRRWFRYAHLCDAPAEKPTTLDGLLFTARAERMFPGEGGIDIRSILACLPEGIPYALEIPGNALVAKVGLAEYARLTLQRTREYLDAVAAAGAQAHH